MKKCSACRVVKDESAFWRNKVRKDGLQHWCIACSITLRDPIKSAEHAAKRRQEKKAVLHDIIEIGKKCSACGIVKNTAEFWKQKLAPDGVQSRCKACGKALADKKACAENSKRYYRLRGGKERQRARYNSETAARNWQKHYRKHREDIAVRRALEMYVRRGAPGKFTKSDIEALLIKQNGRCAYCSCELRTYHTDHILPISRGGTSWPHNLQLTCPRCNHSKRDRDAPLNMRVPQ